MIATSERTRILGGFTLLLSLALMWAGVSEDSGLAACLLILGIFAALFGSAELLFLPRAFMTLCDGLLPIEPSAASLMGWRMIVLLSVIFGAVLFHLGTLAQ
jgi:hypothetical protein